VNRHVSDRVAMIVVTDWEHGSTSCLVKLIHAVSRLQVRGGRSMDRADEADWSSVQSSGRRLHLGPLGADALVFACGCPSDDLNNASANNGTDGRRCGDGLPIYSVFGRDGQEDYVMKLRRMNAVGVACALALAVLAGLSRAQDEKKESSGTKSGKEEVKGKLPIYFGQIGLSKKQEDEVRKAAQPFDEKIFHFRKQIAELDKQIDELDAQKVAACEKVLTDGQRTALMARRDQAEAEKAARKKKAGSADGPKGEDQKP